MMRREVAIQMQSRHYHSCQESRRTRLAIDFSTGYACVSYAPGLLGVCVMITSALLRTETERWREESHLLSSSAWSYPEGSWQSWHDMTSLPLSSWQRLYQRRRRC